MRRDIITHLFSALIRQRIVLIALLILISAALYWFFIQPDTQSEPHYMVQPVISGDLEKVITSLGSLQPKYAVEVGVQVSGQLKNVYVGIGDEVKKGQLLAEIDPVEYQAKVAFEEASLADLNAQLIGKVATLHLNEKIYKRTQSLYQAGAASQQELETATSAYTVAKSAVDSTKAQIAKAYSALQGARAKLAYTKIYAPLSGTVVSQNTQQGQTINANQTAPTLLRIADLNVMTLNAQIAEADIPYLKVGMAGYFMTLGHPERRWYSHIQQVIPTPVTVNNVVLYPVLMDVDNSDRYLRSQMTAQVFFIQEKRKNVALIPLKALQEKIDGKGYQVRVLTNKGPEIRNVTVVLKNRAQAAIASGVKPGEEVIINDMHPASDKPKSPRLDNFSFNRKNKNY